MANTNEGGVLVQEPVRLAVFDFDGTCLKGSSPVMMVRDLKDRNLVNKRHVARLLAWGAQYVFHLPRKRGSAFAIIFQGFEDWSAKHIDEYMEDLFTRVIQPKLRPGALERIRAHQQEGCQVILLSATYDCLVNVAGVHLGVDQVIATHMFKDEHGQYTGFSDGELESHRKVEALATFANKAYGEGKWSVDYAYADHCSDIPVLKEAKHAAVISPSPLMWIASKFHGWDRLSW